MCIDSSLLFNSFLNYVMCSISNIDILILKGFYLKYVSKLTVYLVYNFSRKSLENDLNFKCKNCEMSFASKGIKTNQVNEYIRWFSHHFSISSVHFDMTQGVSVQLRPSSSERSSPKTESENFNKLIELSSLWPVDKFTWNNTKEVNLQRQKLQILHNANKLNVLFKCHHFY